ncbi:DUF3368 domain-containing protein [Porticoccaceae bacterium]|nr:DUF3368 domain-containing protein [Porticoccaceae bacterium]MDC0003478.1 DUF3368 domain-containing protein [Porticoccaceae bacterium]
MDIVVADTTPLIILSRLDLLDDIAELLGTVYLSSGVVQECTANKKLPGAIKIASALEQKLITVRDDFDSKVVERLNLDRGESEAIALALAYQCPLLIDERKGRRIASEMGLDIFGTGAALVMAKNHGIVDSVAPLIQRLDDMGIYLSAKVKSQILLKAKEV